MKTWMAKTESAERNWVLIDATGQPVGRLATKVANIIRGKNKPEFTPHADVGDFVVVVNTDKMELTGNKMENKVYYWHTGFIGGLKQKLVKNVMKEESEKVLIKAVSGMLPKNKLSRKLIKKLHAYSGPNHNQQAQKPRAIN